MSERDLIDELLKAKVKTQLFGGQHAPRLGRLVILESLGSGGMGTVFAAYDPRLDRKVAVKLVRGEGKSGDVLREARALGKLNHPNVVSVFDATDNDGVVAIVMELAPGESLRRFVSEPKPWREVLRVMREAGEGLAAAHRAGIVHRDVKPDNVVIGPDRARLVDFGLASASHAGDELEGSGTPGYMAPERLAGAPADPASDQWSFGVTLYEALHGVRPDASSSPARGSDIPSWLSRVVARTLAADPAARFPSMDALVAELGRDRRRKRRAAALGALTLGLALAAGAFAYRRGASRDLCGGGEARASAVTDRARLRASLGDTPWANKVVDDFVELGSAWAKSHRRVCEATRVHGTQSESLLELRMRCLDRRFERMSALGAALGGSLDAEARENASSAVASLPRPERCESVVDAGELRLPDAEADRTRVRDAERELDRAWATYALGRYREARELAAAVEQRTRDLAFPPFRAGLGLLAGSIEARLGQSASARPRLEAALRDAADARAPNVELEVWVRLLRNELFDGEPAHVVEWAPFARAAAARVGASGAEIDGIEAEALRDAGELGRARELVSRALASHDELRGDQRALLSMNLGAVELASGDAAAAEAAFSRAYELAETTLGHDHPGLGLFLDKLAAASSARGRLAEALGRHGRALELRRRVYGDEDRAVATTLLHRAQTLIEAGRIADAERDLRRAREIRVRVHGPSHRRLGEIDLALGDAAAARGARDEAAALYQSAAKLDTRIDASARLAEVGVAVELRAPLAAGRALTLDAATTAALRVEAAWKRGERAQATEEADRLLAAWRPELTAAISNQVARAEEAVGHRDAAAKAYRAALAALADEPSRARWAAETGLARTGDAEQARQAATAADTLARALPELRRVTSSR